MSRERRKSQKCRSIVAGTRPNLCPCVPVANLYIIICRIIPDRTFGCSRTAQPRCCAYNRLTTNMKRRGGVGLANAQVSVCIGLKDAHPYTTLAHHIISNAGCLHTSGHKRHILGRARISWRGLLCKGSGHRTQGH
ncbi:hypothetical protein DESC_190023 [Desulfosarcina cetonica]|nr:hypothetical protein DESC_190023 [Desulfosarcina cetonica]